MNVASNNYPSQQGTTLIELVVAITIIGIAVLSVMSLFAAVATSSGEALLREQATAIASAYLEEICSKPFLDPDGIEGEIQRNAFDDVDDYNALPIASPSNLQGAPLVDLNQFTVTVSVVPGVLGGIALNEVMLIDVTVSHSTGTTVRLSGYRTRGQP